MKKFKLLTIFLVLNQIICFGQSEPDQVKLSEFYLYGKTVSELRIMRNEIFARYGYKFKSDDLSEYFSKQPWYNGKYDNVDTYLTDVDRYNINLIKQKEELINSKYKEQGKIIYSNESVASREIRKEADKSQVVITRQVYFINHGFNQNGELKSCMVKKTIEKTDIGAEKSYSTVQLEYLTGYPNYDSDYFEVKKYVDDIFLESDYIKTVIYGCCGAENHYALYKPTSKNPFLRFTNEYYIIDIPNSELEFYLGFESNAWGDTVNFEVGKLYFSDVNGIINTVSLRTKDRKDYFDLHWCTPEMKFVNIPENDQLKKDKLTLRHWSQDFLKNPNELNDIVFQIDILGESSGKKDIVTIPIKNGKLFNSSEKEIVIEIDLK